ncbi:MAG: glycoside hydrolase family 127 protein [Spirochaetaceae bacterium]|nr:glycoside hydrolase family 127 protein [Spirochaetaceae bacterium]
MPLRHADHLNVTGHVPALERARDASLDLRGVVREYVDAVIDHWVIPLPETNPAIVEMFEIRDAEPYRAYLPWSGEFAGKYLTGAVQLWRLTGSAPLRERIAGVVARLAESQDPVDGYLGPYPKAERLALWDSTTNEWRWDLWNHYHLMLGLLLWFEDTGDQRALGCARAIADLVCARFLQAKTAIVDEWTGERECAGKVSVYAGPLLMALRADPNAAGPGSDLGAAPIDPVELSRRVSAPDARPAAASRAQAVLQAEHAGHAPGPAPAAPLPAHPHPACGARRTLLPHPNIHTK